MATVWIYPPEILPLKTRAKGASLATAADFLGNFLVVEITPPALKNLGYRTYIILAILNIGMRSLSGACIHRLLDRYWRASISYLIEIGMRIL